MIELPIKQAYDLIVEAGLFQEEEVFMLAVPEDFQKLDKLPLVRINEIDSGQATTASNTIIEYHLMVQVDVWGPLSMLSKVSKDLDHLFSLSSWVVVSSGIDADPDFNDTPRLFKRYKATQQVGLK